MKSKKIIDSSLLKVLLISIVYFGIIISLEFKATSVFLLKFFSKEILNKYLNFIIYGIIFLLAIIFFYKPLLNSLKAFKTNIKKNLKMIGKYLLISYGLTFLCGIILAIFNIGQSTNNETIIEFYKQYGFLVVIDTCLIGPICEEVIYRGILLDLFKGKNASNNRVKIAVILSSLIFAFMHCHTFTLYDILANLPIFTMGCVLGFLYTKTDNILCSSIQHIVINTISTLIIFIAF